MTTPFRDDHTLAREVEQLRERVAQLEADAVRDREERRRASLDWAQLQAEDRKIPPADVWWVLLVLSTAVVFGSLAIAWYAL